VVARAYGWQSNKHFGVASDEDDRQFGSGLMCYTQQIKTVDHGHVDVRYQAIDRCQTPAFEQCGSRAEDEHAMIRRLQQIPERLENARIVIDHCDDGAGRMISHGYPNIKQGLRRSDCAASVGRRI
jgi:hypothetical protein